MQHFNPNELLQIVREIKKVKERVFISVLNIPSHLADALILAFRMDKPPLPGFLFEKTLKNGKVNTIEVNAAKGPRPEQDEWRILFSEKGIKNFVYVGDAQDKEAIADQQITQSQGLNWRVLKPQDLNVPDITQSGGTWYFYGLNFTYGNLVNLGTMENGAVKQLDLQVFLTPHPTTQEISQYFLDGYVKHVLFISDSSTPVSQIDAEKNVLLKHKVGFTSVSLPDVYDPLVLLKIAQQVWQLPHPVVVHMSKVDTEIAQAFITAFNTNVPPILPKTMAQAMTAGRYNLLAPNISTGQAPTEEQFRKLYNAGIRVFNYFGPKGTEEYEAGKKNSSNLKAEWVSTDPSLE